METKSNSIIERYLKDIYGFAVNRTDNTDEAQELAQEIAVAALNALNKNPDITNVEKYMWKIAHNVWVNHVRKMARSRDFVEYSSISGMFTDDFNRPMESCIDSEEKALLLREISYLSDIRRKIIVMHYFKEMPLSQISSVLNIPVGTVKWHLHGSRSELKKGMNIVREKGNLSINPIEFVQIAYCGSEGDMGGPQTLLKGQLRQNVLYAAYYKPMTINEIAGELGVAPPYIRTEVELLVEYDFMTDFENGTYQTNMILWNINDGSDISSLHEESMEVCKKLAQMEIEAMEACKYKLMESGIYYPDSDFNFLLWTAFLMSITSNCATDSFGIGAVPRKDGGKYIAFAQIGDSPAYQGEQQEPVLYYINGPMVNHRHFASGRASS